MFGINFDLLQFYCMLRDCLLVRYDPARPLALLSSSPLAQRKV